MKQQTAVEWLLQIQLSGNGRLHLTDEEFKQALQMEKEQIIESWNDGNFLGRNGNLFVDYSDGKGYYKSEFENK